jgi:hypothetical protein
MIAQVDPCQSYCILAGLGNNTDGFDVSIGVIFKYIYINLSMQLLRGTRQNDVLPVDDLVDLMHRWGFSIVDLLLHKVAWNMRTGIIVHHRHRCA